MHDLDLYGEIQFLEVDFATVVDVRQASPESNVSAASQLNKILHVFSRLGTHVIKTTEVVVVAAGLQALNAW